MTIGKTNATTVTDLPYLPLTGGTLTGSLTVNGQLTANYGIDASGNKISYVGDPLDAEDAANKQYVDEKAKIWQGVCETPMTDAAKEVNVGNGFELKNGVKIRIYFDMGNSNSTGILTLNVNGTGAFDIVPIDGGELPYNFISQGYYDFTYTEAPWGNNGSTHPFWMIDNVKIAGQNSYGFVKVTDRPSNTLGAGSGTAVSPKALQTVKDIADAAAKPADITAALDGYATENYVDAAANLAMQQIQRDFATKQEISTTLEDYVTMETANTMAENFLPKTGGTMTGALLLNADPTEELGAATKQYVDNKTANIATLTNGLVPSSQLPTFYGICSTSSTSSTKAVTVNGTFSLKTGITVYVRFQNGSENVSGTPTLNVNGTGAKTIKYQGTSNIPSGFWEAGSVVQFTYSGSYWYVVGGSRASTSGYGLVKLIDSVTSTDTSQAATPNSVKQAYDLADSANTAAQNAYPKTGGVIDLGINETTQENQNVDIGLDGLYNSPSVSVIQGEKKAVLTLDSIRFSSSSDVNPAEIYVSQTGIEFATNKGQYFYLDSPTAPAGNNSLVTKGYLQSQLSSVSLPTYFGTCATASTSTSKTVTVDSSFSLKTNAIIYVKFSNFNDTETATLNVNDTGDKSITYNNKTTIPKHLWNSNNIVPFIYDGTKWMACTTPKEFVFQYTLLASEWMSNYNTYFYTNYQSSLYNISIAPAGGAGLVDSYDAFAKAKIVGWNDNRIVCWGDIPTIDVTIIATVKGVS